MRLLVLSVVVGGLLGLGAGASAQEADGPGVEATPTDRPKPAEIMRASVEAMAKVKSLSYRAEVSGVGTQGTRTPRLAATVIATRAEKKDPLGWKFRVEGTAPTPEGARAVLAAYDGKKVRSVREEEQRVLEGAGDNSAEPLEDGSGAAVLWLLRWRELGVEYFGNADRQTITRHEGRVDVGGVACDVVHVDYSETSDPNLFDAWWYIGAADRLPRRLDMHLVSGALGDGFIVVTISDLDAAATVDESALALAAPEGFEIVEAQEPEQSGGGRAVRASTLPLREQAPDWELEDPAGKVHRLSDYAGRVVVMDFWATWCGPCRAAMPGLQKVHERFKGKPVEVFGINCWESADPEALMKEMGLTYGLLLKGDQVAKDYGVSGIPTFYIIGKDGRIAHVSVGAGNEEKLVEVISAELAREGGGPVGGGARPRF